MLTADGNELPEKVEVDLVDGVRFSGLDLLMWPAELGWGVCYGVGLIWWNVVVCVGN